MLNPHTTPSALYRSLAKAFQIPLGGATRPLYNPITQASQAAASQNVLPSSGANPHSRAFSTSNILSKRAGRGGAVGRPDPKITMIRYSLEHPVRHIPRPLRFSRTRYLRHWTIQRAWSLYRAQQRDAHYLELERQYTAMRNANEDLRTSCGPLGQKLFRQASTKKGVHGGRSDMGVAAPEGVGERGRVERGREAGVPIEYARGLVDTLGKTGWDYEWRRG